MVVSWHSYVEFAWAMTMVVGDDMALHCKKRVWVSNGHDVLCYRIAASTVEGKERRIFVKSGKMLVSWNSCKTILLAECEVSQIKGKRECLTV